MYQVNGLREIPIAYVHRPRASVHHRHNNRLGSPNFGGVEGSTLEPLQETLGSLAAHCDQVA